MSATANLRRLHARLARETRAELHFDAGTRGIYATDASLYQIIPLCVALPRTVADVAILVRAAAEEGVPIVSRGGATSLSGQTVGAGLIIDFSKYLNRIGIVDRDRMTVRVEPGVVLDQLNRHLGALGLMFGPDVSTSDRATLGGMIGNNSAGARSLRYGKTIDHVHALDVVLDDGTSARFEPHDSASLASICERDDRAARLHRSVRDTVARHEPAIRARFPRILRRVSGYNLDEFVPGLPIRPEGWPDEPWRFNLARLVVGSEGTLAVVTGAEVRVVPKPGVQGLLVVSFESIPAALEHLHDLLTAQPVAVELLDQTILELAAAQPSMAQHLDFAAGRPGAVLAAQFYADSSDRLDDGIEPLAARMKQAPGVIGVKRTLADADRDSFWKVRKAGLSLLMGMVGDAKPVAFVEDTAVAPERLPEFYERFQRIVQRHGTCAACYGHADVGCLHIRPVLNVKTVRGLEQMRGIAAEIAALVGEFGGAMSGEHGDGLSRSLWNEPLFGPEVYAAFLEIKRAFDPHNRLNPGKVVNGPDLTENLRLSPTYHATDPPETGFDHSDQGGFARAIELCSGVGVCRKTDSGTMCPSFMVTRDEAHSTRGRANALRLALSGQLPDGLGNESLRDALDLCLQCKACKSECPSNVDLAKLKVETLYQLSKTQTVPLGSLVLGNYHVLARLAAPFAPLSNALSGSRPAKWLLEKLLKIDRRRTLPRFARQTFRHWYRRRAGRPGATGRPRVILLDDCFTNYHNPEVGQAAVRVLESAGYAIELAGIPCCGRTAISKGLLDQARDLAAEAVRTLAPAARAGVRIVGVEPSCLLTLADEYRDFRLGSEALALAESALLIDDFLANARHPQSLSFRSFHKSVLLHGHCQQKALVGTAGSVAALKLIPGLEPRVLDSGCCGMAGSFGYELGHYDVSSALAGRVLLKEAESNPEAAIAAPGFSCRSQLKDLGGILAVHPIQLLAESLQA